MKPPFRRVLIANRGEIAIRIIRACRELGIESVAVYSDADRSAPHVQAADLAERIGPAPAAMSYLSADAILDAARRSGAEAIHPGYGFLSESAAFARAVESAGLVFVGPPTETMERLGNKLTARQTASAAGVPVIPGLLLPVEGASPDDVADLGFPLLVKAAAGGGGRGMHRVDKPADLQGAIGAAQAEATVAFGDGTVYLERLLVNPRHIEVQLLADQHGTLAVLGERECSVQRRHQKLVEEAPAPGIDSETRQRLWVDARRVAETVRFYSAATVEFLVDPGQRHWFLEMNTRLQVEHGVTEQVTRIDLVAWQLRIAAGDRLPWDLLDAAPRGHAIEVRLYAEDPWNGFRPVAGRIGAWRMPAGPGIRVDAGADAGLEVPVEYDALLAKLMAHGSDRPAAVARLRRALDESLIGGVPTSLGFHRWLVDQPDFVAGTYDTGLVPTRWGEGPAVTPLELSLAVAAVAGASAADGEPASRSAPPADVQAQDRPWTRLGRQEAVER